MTAAIAEQKKQVLTRTLEVGTSELSLDSGRIRIRAVHRNGKQVRLRIEVDQDVRLLQSDGLPAVERVS